MAPRRGATLGSGMRRLAAVCVVALAAAPSANAIVWLKLARTTARPGERVTVYQPAVWADYPRVRVALVRVEDVIEASSPDDERLVPVGEVPRSGRLTFEVPDVEPGRYTLALSVGSDFFAESVDPNDTIYYPLRASPEELEILSSAREPAARCPRSGGAACCAGSCCSRRRTSCSSCCSGSLRSTSSTRQRASAVACALLFAAFLLAPGVPAKLAAVLALGVANAGWYPILKARLYDDLPDRSGTAMTLGSLFGPLGGAAPFAVGLLAERFGLATALWLLLVGPIALVAFVPRREPR